MIRTSPICSLHVHVTPRRVEVPEPPPITPAAEEPELFVEEVPRLKKTARRTILRMAAHGLVTAGLLQEELGITQDAANAALSRLFRAKKLRRVEPGQYVAAGSRL